MAGERGVGGGLEDRAASRRVFISHSSRDTWVARQISRAVEETGAETFLDAARLAVGAEWTEVIRGALARADELVILWTPWSLERPFLWLELGASWLRQIRIAQVLYGVTTRELRDRPDFPSFLLERQMLDIDNLEVFLGQLEQRNRGREGPPEGATDARD